MLVRQSAIRTLHARSIRHVTTEARSSLKARLDTLYEVSAELQLSDTIGALVRQAAEDLGPRAKRIAVTGPGARAFVSAICDDPIAGSDELTTKLASRYLKVQAMGGEPQATGEPEGGAWNETASKASYEGEGPSSRGLRETSGDGSEAATGLAASPTSDTPTTLILSAEPTSFSPDSRHVTIPESAWLASLDAILIEQPTPLHLYASDILVPFAALPPQFMGKHVLPTGGVDPQRALDALATYADDGSFEAYQASLTASGVGPLRTAISESVRSIDSAETSEFVYERALDALVLRVAEADDALHSAQQALAELEESADRTRQLARASIKALSPVADADNSVFSAEITHLLTSRIPWWRLFMYADQLPAEVAVVVDGAMLRTLESQVGFETGRLAAIAADTAAHTHTMLRATPAFNGLYPPGALESLTSSVVENEIAKAQAQAAGVSCTALSAPIVTRRNQITAAGGPAEELQRRAQAAVTHFTTLAASSGAAALMAQVAYHDAFTTCGVGLFGSTLACWLMQTRWIRARKRFIADTERVLQGVQTDIAAAGERLLDRCLYQATVAGSLLSAMLAQKQGVLSAVKGKLGEVGDRTSERSE